MGRQPDTAGLAETRHHDHGVAAYPCRVRLALLPPLLGWLVAAVACSAPERQSGQVFGATAPTLAGTAAPARAAEPAPAAALPSAPVAAPASSRSPRPTDEEDGGAELTEAQLQDELQRILSAGEEAVQALAGATDLPGRLLWARVLHGARRNAEAEALLEVLASEHPACLPARLELARLQLERNAPAAAAAVLAAAPSAPRDAADGAQLAWLRAVADWRLGGAEGERFLRNQLADGPEPIAAALELASRLADADRHAHALAVIDRALERVPGSPEARRRRADLLRDLGRRDQALAELRALFGEGEDGRRKVHPRVLYDVAWLAWLEGERGAAAAALAAIAELHADHPFTRAAEDELRKLAAEVSGGGRPSRILVTDVLGSLRGAPLASERLAGLETLVAQGGALRDRALRIAAGDPSPALRARAVALAELPAEALAERVGAALGDAHWQVRAAAAEASTRLPPELAVELLLDAMRAEDSGYAFSAMHRALSRATGDELAMPVGAAEDPEERAALVRRWREQWAK